MAKKCRFWMFFYIFYTFTGFATTLKSQLDQIIKPLEPQAHIGVVVSDLTLGKTIYQYHGRAYYIPASILKLLPAIISLDKMGPDYQYNTWLMSDASTITNNSLNGNLYIKFAGDPSFQANDLKMMLMSLKPINHIRGHVYIDSSAFDSPNYPPGRVWDDLAYAYGAPISSVIINQNKWRLNIKPAIISGKKANLFPQTLKNIVQIDNETITTPSWRDQCPITVYHQGPNHFIVKGCVPKPAQDLYRKLAFTDPKWFAKKLIKEDLLNLHIDYRGEVTFKVTPDSANYLRFQASPKLSILLKTMLQDSDNVYAGALLKTLGLYSLGYKGSFNDGLKVMNQFLKNQVGWQNFRVADASGLSRYNLISPIQVNELLKYAYQSPSIYQALYQALSIPGVVGTLKKRQSLIGMDIHAKTGSMTGIIALAGYMKNKKNHLISFVIMCNNFIGTSKKIYKLEKNVCENIKQFS